jgi:uncharacterized membrane protein (UPF0127 family)
MANVQIPLDIIFINKNLEIVKIEQAEPNDNRLFRAYCKYVVETNSGFCSKNNIEISNTVSLDGVNEWK